MKHSINHYKQSLLACVIALSFPLNAIADEGYDALKAQVDALQKQLQEVKETLKQYKTKSATKQEVEKLKQDVATASTEAAEWKSTDSIVHLAGYGDATYSDAEDTNAAFSGARFNPIFHYQYKDILLLESELEFEIGEDGGTEVALEYLAIDYLLNDYLTVIGGKFLSPLGQFRQNFHPSWINKLPTAPPGFGHDQAAPNAEIGLQARGGFPIGSNSMYANYAVYVGNGPILEIVGDEIEEINTGGRTSNDDDKFVFGGRIGFLPIPMLEIGFSGATGKVAGESEPDITRDYDVYGVDFAFNRNNLRLRGEYIMQDVGANTSSAAPESASWDAWFTQVSYRFLPTAFEGVVRYSDYDSPHNSEDQKQWALGVNYLFSSNAMAKFAYNFNDGENGSVTDNSGFQLQLSYGF